MNFREAYQILGLESFPIPNIPTIDRAARNLVAQLRLHPDQNFGTNVEEHRSNQAQMDKIKTAQELLTTFTSPTLEFSAEFLKIGVTTTTAREEIETFQEKTFERLSQIYVRFISAGVIEPPNMIKTNITLDPTTSQWRTNKKIDLTSIPPEEYLEIVEWIAVMQESGRLLIMHKIVFRKDNSAAFLVNLINLFKYQKRIELILKSTQLQSLIMVIGSFLLTLAIGLPLFIFFNSTLFLIIGAMQTCFGMLHTLLPLTKSFSTYFVILLFISVLFHLYLQDSVDSAYH